MRLLPKKRNSPGQLPRSLQPLKENHMSIFSDLVDAVKEHSKVVEAVIAELSTPVVEDDVKVLLAQVKSCTESLSAAIKAHESTATSTISATAPVVDESTSING